MATAGTAVLEAKDKLPMANCKQFCTCLGSILGTTMGGSSGVLMAIMWTGMATSFEKQGVNSWKSGGAQAFMDGLDAMMAAGGASPGSRTMLDASCLLRRLSWMVRVLQVRKSLQRKAVRQPSP